MCICVCLCNACCIRLDYNSQQFDPSCLLICSSGDIYPVIRYMYVLALQFMLISSTLHYVWAHEKYILNGIEWTTQKAVHVQG